MLMAEGSFLQNQEHHLSELEQLRRELEQLKRENVDLKMTLLTTTEHGDTIEAQLYETNVKLQAEIIERRRAEAMLEALIEMISREKGDLEIVVQTIMEHGDVLDIQWQQKLSEARLLATSDGLTQIPNRRRFDEYLNKQWQQMSREQAPLSVILSDIDYFKQYNDYYGHLAGDRCLKQIAQALQAIQKSPNDLVARYGGEEFAAILPYTNAAEAIQTARQMQQAIAEMQIPHIQSLVSPYITLSIGVASTMPQQERSPNHLLDRADRLLYLAKHQGRNQIVHHAIA